MDITLCIPKPWGDEDRSVLKIIGMNSVPIVWRDVQWDYVQQRVGNIMDPHTISLRVNISMPISIICIQMTWDVWSFPGRYP